MKRPVFCILILLGSLLAPLAASAAPIRAFVAEFTVSPADSADLKATLTRLFSSRLSGDGISMVDSAAQADVVISGSYTLLGKIFSLDAFAKTAAGKPVASAYEQGDSLDSLIPAVGKISAKLKGDIVQQYQPSAGAARPPEVKAAASEIVRRESVAGSTSQRIPGALRSLSSCNSKEYLLADESAIRLYRQGATLALVAEAALPSQQKILAVDSVCLEGDGKSLAFVTIVDREVPASRIYEVQDGKLKLVAENQPYLFRAIALNGGPKKLYAQQMGRTEDYYGDVYEASYADGSVKIKNPIKMPRYANIFNFNMFRDQSGKSFLTAFSDSGYLVVYSDSGEELWRSNDKFGGSETYFQRRDPENERTTGTPFRTRFIDQRISVTEQGEIIVPQNSGFLVLGNARSYSKSSIVSFTWNGSSLEELWRTKQSQNYLADYSYQPGTKELVLLEVSQKSGLFGKGGSAIRVISAQ